MRCLAAVVPVLVVVGVGVFFGTASAAEPCSGACVADAEFANQTRPTTTVTTTVTVYPDPATVTVYPDPVTVHPDPATVTVRPDPATVTRTETETVVVTPDQGTVTERVTIPNTTVTVPTTVTTTLPEPAAGARQTMTEQGADDLGAGGVVTSTQLAAVTDRTTETAFEKAFLTDQVTNTVAVTRYAAAKANPQTGQTPAVTAGASEVTAAGSVTLSGSGFTPKERVTLTLHSAPVLLETVQADGQGDFQTEVTIPANTSLGKHTIHVVGVSSGVETIVPLTVVAPSATTAADQAASGSDLLSASRDGMLSYAGVDLGSAGAVSAMFIGCGAGLVVIARRRPRPGRHRG